MKVRNGFVSNSSSSSFIIDFKKETISENDIKEFLLSLGYEFDDITLSVSKFMNILKKVDIDEYKEYLLDTQNDYNGNKKEWYKEFLGSRINSYKNIISKIENGGNTLFNIDVTDTSSDYDFIPVNNENLLEYILYESNHVFERFNNH